MGDPTCFGFAYFDSLDRRAAPAFEALSDLGKLIARTAPMAKSLNVVQQSGKFVCLFLFQNHKMRANMVTLSMLLTKAGFSALRF